MYLVKVFGSLFSTKDHKYFCNNKKYKTKQKKKELFEIRFFLAADIQGIINHRDTEFH